MIYRESAEQITLIEWCRASGYPYNLIFSIENEGIKSPQAGARAKAMGKRAGIPDLFLPYASGKYHGLFIEMKAHGGRVSAPQKIVLTELAKEGYFCVVCFGVEEAIEILKKYVSLQTNARK